jgi:hypothetical protein
MAIVSKTGAHINSCLFILDGLLTANVQGFAKVGNSVILSLGRNFFYHGQITKDH